MSCTRVRRSRVARPLWLVGLVSGLVLSSGAQGAVPGVGPTSTVAARSSAGARGPRPRPPPTPPAASWSRSPGYAAPWTEPTPSKPSLAGSVLEFFFWFAAVGLGVAVLALVDRARRRRREAEWATSPSGQADATPGAIALVLDSGRALASVAPASWTAISLRVRAIAEALAGEDGDGLAAFLAGPALAAPRPLAGRVLAVELVSAAREEAFDALELRVTREGPAPARHPVVQRWSLRSDRPRRDDDAWRLWDMPR